MELDERQEMTTAARRMAENAAIIHQSLLEVLPQHLADDLTQTWWRITLSQVGTPDFGSIIQGMLNKDD